MRINFTQPAKDDLALIVQYFTDAGFRLRGRKIRAKIINYSMKLKTLPQLGKADEIYSKKYKRDCRFLVCDNYKIIYSFDKENVVIIILNVFDTRRNPHSL